MFGLLDDVLDSIERESKPTVKLRPKQERPLRPMSALPEIEVSPSDTPPEFGRVQYENVVRIPVHTLKSTTAAIDRRTKAFSAQLIEHLIPLLLAYSAGTNYTQAVLKEGLKLDLEFDEGLEEAVKHIGYLNVVQYFIRNSKLPKSMKKLYMRQFVRKLSDRSVDAIFELNKKADTAQRMSSELQAVVMASRARTSTPAAHEGHEAPSAPSSNIARSRKMRG